MGLPDHILILCLAAGDIIQGLFHFFGKAVVHKAELPHEAGDDLLPQGGGQNIAFLLLGVGLSVQQLCQLILVNLLGPYSLQELLNPRRRKYENPYDISLLQLAS